MKSVISSSDSCCKRKKFDDCSDNIVSYAVEMDEKTTKEGSENVVGSSRFTGAKDTSQGDDGTEEVNENVMSSCKIENEAWRAGCNDSFPVKNNCKINFSKSSVITGKCSEKCSQTILMEKPFRNHWTAHKLRSSTIVKPQKSFTLKRTFTVPTQKIDVSENSNFIDFWQSIDNGVRYTLPIVSHGKSDSIPRISCSVLHETITSKYCVTYKIIDCRFDYEYNGGHIKDAVNIDNIDSLVRSIPSLKNHILIFHCEFSSVRAPRIAKYLRNYDRFNNEYPSLDFPEIYVLEGGYKEFYGLYKECCYPQNYIVMSKHK